MACCIGLMFFASCKKKDVQPTINIVTSGNYVGQNAEVYSGDEIAVGFSLTGENLTQIMLNAEQNGTILYTYTEALANESSYFYAKNFTIEAVGTVTIYGTVTDAKGHTASTSFNINCNEKPNAKFVGHYEGTALLNGTIDLQQNGQSMFNNELNNYEVALVMQLEPGTTINEVTGFIIINEQQQDFKGIVDGNTVTFEGINDEFSMNIPVGAISVSPNINTTYNIVGNLENNTLILSGECKGEGNFNIPFFGSGDIYLDTTISGNLNKTE